MRTLDGVLVLRTGAGRTKDLPDGILAVDTWLGYSDIMVIKHTGKYSHLRSNILRC
jgi:hypothetical protein